MAIIRAIFSVLLAIAAIALVLGIGALFTVIGAVLVPLSLGVLAVAIVAGCIYAWWNEVRATSKKP